MLDETRPRVDPEAPPDHVVSEFALAYESDELAFISGSSRDPRNLIGLGRFFELPAEVPNYDQVVNIRNVITLYTIMTQAKKIRAQISPDETYKRNEIKAAFTGCIDNDAYTIALLGDILATKLVNPISPSSQSVLNVLTTMSDELGIQAESAMGVKTIIEKVLAGKISLPRQAPKTT